jgi:tetratricopeptide (TPR) repeat protein
MLGMLLDMQGRKADAEKQYQKTLSIDSKAAVAANNLAWMYAEKGENLDEALQLAQTALSALPKQAEVRDTVGWVYCKKQLWAQALPLFEQNVREEPKNGNYQYRLGVAQKGVGNIAAASRSLSAALTLPLGATESSEAKRLLATLQ